MKGRNNGKDWTKTTNRRPKKESALPKEVVPLYGHHKRVL